MYVELRFPLLSKLRETKLGVAESFTWFLNENIRLCVPIFNFDSRGKSEGGGGEVKIIYFLIKTISIISALTQQVNVQSETDLTALLINVFLFLFILPRSSGILAVVRSLKAGSKSGYSWILTLNPRGALPEKNWVEVCGPRLWPFLIDLPIILT